MEYKEEQFDGMIFNTGQFGGRYQIEKCGTKYLLHNIRDGVVSRDSTGSTWVATEIDRHVNKQKDWHPESTTVSQDSFPIY